MRSAEHEERLELIDELLEEFVVHLRTDSPQQPAEICHPDPTVRIAARRLFPVIQLLERASRRIDSVSREPDGRHAISNFEKKKNDSARS